MTRIHYIIAALMLFVFTAIVTNHFIEISPAYKSELRLRWKQEQKIRRSIQKYGLKRAPIPAPEKDNQVLRMFGFVEDAI